MRGHHDAGEHDDEGRERVEGEAVVRWFGEVGVGGEGGGCVEEVADAVGLDEHAALGGRKKRVS